jgi:hypothetical protein
MTSITATAPIASGPIANRERRPKASVGERVNVGPWRYAIIESDLPKADRHVLLTLAVRMKEDGSGARQSLASLAREVGYKSTSELATALNRVEKTGWLIREKGGGRRTTRYFATAPELSGVPDTSTELSDEPDSSPPIFAPELSGGPDTNSKEQQSEQQQRAHAQGFAALVAELPGAPLSGGGRALVEVAWLEDPEGIARLVRSTRVQKAKSPAGFLVRCVGDGDHKREEGRKARPKPPCPECEVGGGEHVDGCSQAAREG